MEGKPGGNPVYCDVRDVVDAHIAAAETPGASGRYMVTHTHSSNPREVSEFLRVSRRGVENLRPVGPDACSCRSGIAQRGKAHRVWGRARLMQRVCGSRNLGGTPGKQLASSSSTGLTFQ